MASTVIAKSDDGFGSSGSFILLIYCWMSFYIFLLNFASITDRIGLYNYKLFMITDL